MQGMHDFSMADVLREVELLYLVGGHPGVVGLREVRVHCSCTYFKFVHRAKLLKGVGAGRQV